MTSEFKNEPESNVILDAEIVAFYERVFNQPVSDIPVSQYHFKGYRHGDVIAMTFADEAEKLVLNTPMRVHPVNFKMNPLRLQQTGIPGAGQPEEYHIDMFYEMALLPMFGLGIHPCRNITVSKSDVLASMPVHLLAKSEYIRTACILYRLERYLHTSYDKVMNSEDRRNIVATEQQAQAAKAALTQVETAITPQPAQANTLYYQNGKKIVN